jgi:hypothetical protein
LSIPREPPRESLIPGLRREESVTAISFRVDQLEDEWDD